VRGGEEDAVGQLGFTRGGADADEKKNRRGEDRHNSYESCVFHISSFFLDGLSIFQHGLLHSSSRLFFFAVEKRRKDANLRGSLLAHLGDGQQASIHVGLKEGTKV
jgi:hypothetical protein